MTHMPKPGLRHARTDLAVLSVLPEELRWPKPLSVGYFRGIRIQHDFTVGVTHLTL